GDPPILVVFDAGYDVTRLAYLLADLPVELLGRLRSDRVLYFPPPPRAPGPGPAPAGHHGPPAHPVRHRHGSELGPAAPPADQPGRPGAPRRRAARH